jgi:preprotein translocase subunit SecF
MEFFKFTAPIDFMKYRRVCATISIVLVAASVGSVFWPGPNYGIDFKGGTELEVEFKGTVTSAELRKAVTALGHHRPEVVAVGGSTRRFILRTQEVSSVAPEQAKKIEAEIKTALGETKLEGLQISPGGDKVSMRLSADVEPSVIEAALAKAGADARGVTRFGKPEDHRFEAALIGVGDKLVKGLQDKLGDRAPESPLRAEWVGPKVGAQLRDAAVKSLLYALALILVYVAFRFDLRFAPGGIIALFHDAAVVVGAYVLLQKEFTLATVAAILTVIGYSINDTIVIYDRIRENMAKMREASLAHLINVSTTQTLSRTIITSSVTLLSILGFFVWGTPVIKDITFALAIGFLSGTYSTVFIAAPVTEWMDRRFFRKA